MVQVNVIRVNDVINEVLITGHAGYSVAGKDIVCSSISSIVITTINGLMKIDETSITHKLADDLHIVINKHDNVTEMLILNMIELLTELSQQFSENLKIIYREVS